LDALVCTFLNHLRGADEVSQWGVRAAHHCFKLLSVADEVIRQWGVTATHHCLAVFKALWRTFLCNPNMIELSEGSSNWATGPEFP